MPNDLTPAIFAVFLTAAGAPIGAVVVTKLIDFIQNFLPGLVVGREKLAALVGAVAIVALSAVVGLSEVPPRYVVTGPEGIIIFVVGLALAVYNITRLAMATHDDLAHSDDKKAITNAEGWNGS